MMDLFFKGLLQVTSTRVDDQVFEAHAGELFRQCDDAVQDPSPLTASGQAASLAKVAKSVRIGGRGGINQGLLVLQLGDGSLKDIHACRTSESG